MKNSLLLSLEEHLQMKGLSSMCEQPRLLPRCDCLIVALTLIQTESSWGGWWMMGGLVWLGEEK